LSAKPQTGAGSQRCFTPTLLTEASLTDLLFGRPILAPPNVPQWDGKSTTSVSFLQYELNRFAAVRWFGKTVAAIAASLARSAFGTNTNMLADDKLD
jgi:hypothetical protein